MAGVDHEAGAGREERWDGLEQVVRQCRLTF
jgi:hypothetical protein